MACSDDSTVVKPDSGRLLDLVVKKDVAQPDKTSKLDKGPPPDTTSKSATVCGNLEDPQGNKLGNAPVIMCNDLECQSATSTPGGTFCVTTHSPSWYVVHAQQDKSSSKHTTDLIVPITITAADIAAEKKFDLGKMVVPVAGPAKTVDITNGGTYDLGGGVSFTVAAGATVKPPLLSQVDLAGALVAKGNVHAQSTSLYKGSGALVAGLSTVPLETTFSKPVSFKITGTGATAGAALEVYFLSDTKGTLTKHCDATADSSGAVVNASGQGLTALGWFLIFTK